VKETAIAIPTGPPLPFHEPGAASAWTPSVVTLDGSIRTFGPVATQDGSAASILGSAFCSAMIMIPTRQRIATIPVTFDA